ncbi:restriction endonuclease subunit S [Shouchella clausii]|uniref:restriction endonuclease subunit S n=1 Tax=Shouchella clausii TaxID=79880 RepID=UPI000792AE6F|nr:restriction endonuclease subunit S [Shouchella clausii]KKI86575.1 hypothetical protein WZ76_09045 [Shouchella clausii]
MKDWIEGKLEDLIEINPTVKLEKGKVYPFVSMDIITPFYKPVESIEVREFKSGGSKFYNGDTLFARITPCLENGKIAKVKNLNGGKGFGSTEFFILRGKEGITDNEFVYYLSTSKFFRKNAEKLMTGTSGRQRVDKQQFAQQIVRLPSIGIQRKIASILKNIDDKIELNNKMNKTLEGMAMTLYKHWFVDFGPFQDGEFEESELGLIPKGWEVVNLKDVVEISYGKSLPNKKRVPGPYPVFGSSGVVGTHEFSLVKAPGIVVGRKGTIGNIFFTHEDFYPIDTTYYVTPREKQLNYETLYCMLKQFDFKRMNNDSAVPGLNRNDAYNLQLVKPQGDIWLEFGMHIKNIFNLIKTNNDEMSWLKETRNYLLPKLLSSEIDLSEVKETVEDTLQ